MSFTKTSFERVAAMNEAFGNPRGEVGKVDFVKIFNQSVNIFDEYLELLEALGVKNDDLMGKLKFVHDEVIVNHCQSPFTEVDVHEARDALCDIQVFGLGAQHMMGVNGDADMQAVVNGVMTRFVKDEADKEATIKMHAAKGVTDVYFEGEFPEMVMKSARDQPDAPKGKFLKSASYSQAVFPDTQVYEDLLATGVPFETALWYAQKVASR